MLLDSVVGSDWYLVSNQSQKNTRRWCRTISKEDLDEHSREIDLLLNSNDAVLIRPDRYIFGFAEEHEINNLLDEAEKKMGI